MSSRTEGLKCCWLVSSYIMSSQVVYLKQSILILCGTCGTQLQHHFNQQYYKIQHYSSHPKIKFSWGTHFVSLFLCINNQVYPNSWTKTIPQSDLPLLGARLIQTFLPNTFLMCTIETSSPSGMWRLWSCRATSTGRASGVNWTGDLH